MTHTIDSPLIITIKNKWNVVILKKKVYIRCHQRGAVWGLPRSTWVFLNQNSSFSEKKCNFKSFVLFVLHWQPLNNLRLSQKGWQDQSKTKRSLDSCELILEVSYGQRECFVNKKESSDENFYQSKCTGNIPWKLPWTFSDAYQTV